MSSDNGADRSAASVYEAVRSVIEWPYASQVLDVVYDAVAANTWTVLPPGSHVAYRDVDRTHRGANVVALRSDDKGALLLNDRGEQFRLVEGWWLVVGQEGSRE